MGVAQGIAVLPDTGLVDQPVILFAMKDPENIYRVIMGEKIGTVVE